MTKEIDVAYCARMWRSQQSLLLSVCLAAAGVPGIAEGPDDIVRPSSRPGFIVSEDVDDLVGLSRVFDFQRLDQPTLDHLVALRRWYGLDAEAAYVTSLYENPPADGVYISTKMLVGGIRFLADEVNDVLSISQLEYSSTRIADLVQSTLGDDGFAGAEVRQRKLSVFCKACDRAAVERQIDESGEDTGVGNTIEIVEVDYAIADLTAVEGAVSQFLLASGREYVGSGIDFGTNTVLVVGPSSLGPLVLAAFPTEPVRFEVDESAPVDQVSKWDPLGYLVVEGGQGIMRSDVPYQWAACTSGFAVNSPAFGPFILTAGHCSSLGAGCVLSHQWIQGGSTLGVMSACRFQGNLDVAMISTYGWRNNIGRIHSTAADYFHSVTFAVTTQNLSGVTVCNHGRASGVPNPQCGTVTSLTFRPSGVGDDGNLWSADFVRATYISVDGDSGSGITWPTIYGFGAAGIHKSADATSAYFTKFSRVASYWSLTLTPP